ncbi:MAG: hypothetical protein WA966_02385 [Ornithinimicrobium sp.]
MNKRPHWVLAGFVAVVFLIVLIAVAVRGSQPSQDLDVATPEGTVQAFLRDVFDDDLEQAATYLDPDGECTLEDLRQEYYQDAGRVVLIDTDTSESVARVAVDVVYPSEPLDTDVYTERQTYRLASTADGWVLQGTPWPLFVCGDGP